MARIKKFLGGDTSTSDAPQTDTSWGIQDAGPYIGIVKDNRDPLKQGGLKVVIPALAGKYQATGNQLIPCRYLSPFYGAKGLTHVTPGTKYTDSQFSYGFWAVPPDIETKVLVIFAEGKFENGFWIGCVQDQLTNHMVPGIAASDKVVDDTGENANDKYQSTKVPAGEVNRYAGVTYENYDQLSKPVHPFADILRAQGLIQDTIRGTTTSSAQRETPSQVFGMSTPGRKNTDATAKKVGASDSGRSEVVDRLSGHTFVMDDGDQFGNNQLTRLRTASGHQLLMHDTEGVVYIANGSGKSWIEMSSDGKLLIYAQDGVNIRGDGNFDLHSGADINFHAKNDIKFTSEGSITMNSDNYLMHMGRKGIFSNAEQGAVRAHARDGISSYTAGTQLHGAGGRIDLAGSQVHFNSVGASPAWGPSWLNPEAVGIVTDESQNDVNITVGPNQTLEANTRKTKTTVPNIVTHEPFTRAPSAVLESVSKWQDPVKWKQLSQTPGTLEYMAQQNRESDNEYIQQLQFFADQKKYIDDFKKNPILNLGDNAVQLKQVADINQKISSLNINDASTIKFDKNELKILQDVGAFDPRESTRLGQTIEENIKANSQVIQSKLTRVAKDFGQDLINKGAPNVSLDSVKQLSDKFTSAYNTTFGTNTVVQNLSKANLSQILVPNVIAGKITSVASKFAGSVLGKVSANSLPPSLRGSVAGRITQVATSIKSNITKIGSAIGNVFKGFRF